VRLQDFHHQVGARLTVMAPASIKDVPASDD
jgi:hypothetical protein